MTEAVYYYWKKQPIWQPTKFDIVGGAASPDFTYERYKSALNEYLGGAEDILADIDFSDIITEDTNDLPIQVIGAAGRKIVTKSASTVEPDLWRMFGVTNDNAVVKVKRKKKKSRKKRKSKRGRGESSDEKSSDSDDDSAYVSNLQGLNIMDDPAITDDSNEIILADTANDIFADTANDIFADTADNIPTDTANDIYAVDTADNINTEDLNLFENADTDNILTDDIYAVDTTNNILADNIDTPDDLNLFEDVKSDTDITSLLE